MDQTTLFEESEPLVFGGALGIGYFEWRCGGMYEPERFGQSMDEWSVLRGVRCGNESALPRFEHGEIGGS